MTSRPKLTEGPVAPTLARLTAPMLVALVSMVGFNIVDTFFIGRLGTEALAAISFTFPVVFVITSVALGISVGAGAVISRAIGKGDVDRIRRLTTDAVSLAFVLVLVLASLGLATLEPLFTALGADATLLPLISAYMVPWLIGVPAVIISMVGNGAIRATGDTRTPAMIMLVALAVNLVLDPVLIFGLGPIPALGLQGAAFATIGARSISLLASLYILGRRERMLTLALPPLAEALASWRDILYIGLPASLTNLIVPASMALVTRIVASFGVEAVAGFGVSTRLEMLPLMMINALASVLVPFVGQNWGAGRMDRVESGVKQGHLFALGVGAVALAVFWVVGAPVARLFDDDPEVVRTVVLYSRIVGVGWGLQGVIALSTAAFNALNLPLRSTALSLLRMVVLYVPLAWAFSLAFDLVGVFMGALVANLVGGVIALLWVRSTVRGLAGEEESEVVVPEPSPTALAGS